MRRTTKRAVIALDLAHLDSPGLVSFARAIGKGLTGNVNLTAADVAKLPVAVTDLLAAATALETTHTGRPTTPSKANTKLEREQANTLMEQLTNTAAFVEGLANTKAAGDVTVADSIVVSFGFQLKKAAVRRPKEGFAVASLAKGTARVHLPNGAKSAVRLLQYSADTGKTYSPMVIVHGLVITVTGLKSGTDYLFQFAISAPPAKKAKATITAGSEAPQWSDAISCVIS